MPTSAARALMIDAAEQIVADRGLAAMSLREVQAVAGQSNKSAAQYHFGSREGLIEAVVEARMGPIDEQRIAMLDELARSEEITIRQVVEVLVLPLADASLRRRDGRYARFLAQAMLDPTLAVLVRRNMRARSFRQIYRLLIKVANLPPELAALRTGNLIVFAVVTLAVWEAPGELPYPIDMVIADLVDSCVVMLGGPTVPPSLAAADGGSSAVLGSAEPLQPQ